MKFLFIIVKRQLLDITWKIIYMNMYINYKLYNNAAK